eukprot:jgi/Ulvmu1/10585/UM065_0039.1
MSVPDLQASTDQPGQMARTQGAKVDYDSQANMLHSGILQPAASRTRVYRQVKTDVFEFFTEVRGTTRLWQRVFPWRGLVTHGASTIASVGHTTSSSQRAAAAVYSMGIVVGGCVSGVLGGMAIMTILHLNLFNLNMPGDRSDIALLYYAPIALAVNRTYWGLISVAVSSSLSRAVWISTVMSWCPGRSLYTASAFNSLGSATWRAIAALCYSLAFVLNITHSAVDSELTYAIDRNATFYTSPLSEHFLLRFQQWRVLNSIKSAALILAWIAVVLEWQPRDLAQLIHDAGNDAATQVAAMRENATSKYAICRHGAAGTSAVLCRSGTMDNTSNLYTNPAFHTHDSKTPVPMYPSAGAGII